MTNLSAKAADVAGIPVASIDGQHLVCLLYVLRETGGGRRREVNDFIRNQGLLAFNQEDHVPYPSQSEPAWMTDIAWARKIGVLSAIISDEERNAWELNRAGATELDRVFSQAAAGALPASGCFLWSTKLKRMFVPSYVPADIDSPRPPRRRRRESPHYYLSAMEEMFARGKGENVATKLKERLGRFVPASPVACAIAHKEWEDRRFQELLNELGKL